MVSRDPSNVGCRKAPVHVYPSTAIALSGLGLGRIPQGVDGTGSAVERVRRLAAVSQSM